MRLIRLEGDVMRGTDLTHFQRTFGDGCVLVNGLGATEFGLARQYFYTRHAEAPSDGIQPVGYQVDGVEVQVHNIDGGLADDDEVGELVVTSDFLALGYWRNETLTSQRFCFTEEGRRAYRSGDFGQIDANGCLTVHGRAGSQVKIAGQFVDTSEIESALCGMDEVRASIVQARAEDGDQLHLVAYVVPTTKSRPSVTRMRSNLSKLVPTIAIPSTFVFLEELPLTLDGKVDRRRLPAASRCRPLIDTDYMAPTTNLEKKIAEIWCRVLGLDVVGIDDAFLELGGDSLTATQVVTALNDSEETPVSIVDMFEFPTIRSLCAYLTQEPSAPQVNPVTSKSHGVINGRHPNLPAHSIAVIGMAGRFPGAENVQQLWNNLREGKESITFFANEQQSLASDFDNFVPARGVLDDVETFDANFFGLTPRQARDLDPQQRLWLECVHHAMEDALLPVPAQHHDVGVFAGCRDSSYLWHLLAGDRTAVDRLLRLSDDDVFQLQLGNDREGIATRTSFLYNFTGPSINVQTACSTSLVAIAMACESLTTEQCNLAIAGGACVTFPHRRGYRQYPGSIYSQDGHCRAFDANASGTVFSDGVGVVVLKRVEEAIADGDPIVAVIRGWAINNDGSSKASFTAPNVDAQARVIARAHERAQVSADDIDYVEAHGTGTLIGDPIEVAGLSRAFARSTRRLGYCGVGSVKSNIGHLDAAAGVAGFIKTALALQHGELPPSLHFEQPNPAIGFERTPFQVVDRRTAWPERGRPRFAGVSSFGVGGTNCHVVLQSAPIRTRETHNASSGSQLVTISAKSGQAQVALEHAYIDHLKSTAMHHWGDFATSTQQSRAAFDWRTAIVASSAHDAVAALSKPEGAANIWRGKVNKANPPQIGFLFSGQGSQFVGATRGLYRTQPRFRQALGRCDETLGDSLGHSLLDVMYGQSAVGELVNRTDYTHVVLFAMHYALCEVLSEWGITPSSVLGHSVGEYAAACVAGVMSCEAALSLVAARGRLLAGLPAGGKMLAVRASRDALAPLIQPLVDTVSIAASNAPGHSVLSGASHCIESLKATCERRQWSTSELNVSHAFHSPLVEPVLEPLLHLAQDVKFAPPAMSYFSAVTGAQVVTEVTDASYWRDHARCTVEFAQALGSMHDAGCNVFLEIGPNAILTPLVRANLASSDVLSASILRRGVDDSTALNELLARLYVRGVDIDWNHASPSRSRRNVKLPSYPFQRKRYWREPQASQTATSLPLMSEVHDVDLGDPLIGRRIPLPGSDEVRFAVRYSTDAPTYLNDHRLFDVPVAPGASHLAMLAQSVAALHDDGQVEFRELFFIEPLIFSEQAARNVQLVFRPNGDERTLQLLSSPVNEDEWTCHMLGQVVPAASDWECASNVRLELAKTQVDAMLQMSGAEFYTRIWANQGGTGSAFRWIDSIWRKDGEAICRAQCPAAVDGLSSIVLHPGLIEAACQVLHCCHNIETEATMNESGMTYVPFSVERFRSFARCNNHRQAWCRAVLTHYNPQEVVADLEIFADDGAILAEIHGFCLRTISRDQIKEGQSPPVRNAAVSKVHGESTGSPEIPDDLPMSDVLRYLQLLCAELTGQEVAEITPGASLLELDFDSLTAVLLVNRVKREIGVSLSMGRVLGGVTVAGIADDIEGKPCTMANNESDRPKPLSS